MQARRNIDRECYDILTDLRIGTVEAGRRALKLMRRQKPQSQYFVLWMGSVFRAEVERRDGSERWETDGGRV